MTNNVPHVGAFMSLITFRLKNMVQTDWNDQPPFISSSVVLILFLPSPPCVLSGAAVQEERQRNREREGELEFSVSVNEEMPVEKILAAETAVEQKTELHSDGISSGNSVRKGGKTY